MFLREEIKCFVFLVGYESFVVVEGVIKIVEKVNRVRKEFLRVILNGFGKDVVFIILRINGFIYV